MSDTMQPDGDRGVDEALLEFQRPVTTGGAVVLFREGMDRNAEEKVLGGVGLRGLFPSDTEELVAMAAEGTGADEAIVLDEFGVALLPPGEPGVMSDQATMLMSADGTEFVRPEFYYFADAPPFHDDASRTWGIAAVGADASSWTGDGIRLAVLDTGIDLTHPDYTARTISAQSFVPGETVQDLQGHGTHCAGTAAGRRVPGGPRYGVAPDVALHVGKVLSNGGSGTDRWIIAGIRWALASRCEVISMSLGASVRRGETHDPVYERIASRALAAGTLIIAAAGNESRRQLGYIAPVGRPANSPSILAVGALDQNLDVGYFSCGDMNGGGGIVNLAAPGVDVFSSFPVPRGYRSLQGTSMACPHVAGVAALWAQSDPTLRGRALWDKLAATVVTLPHPVRDVGSGLVQAP